MRAREVAGKHIIGPQLRQSRGPGSYRVPVHVKRGQLDFVGQKTDPPPGASLIITLYFLARGLHGTKEPNHLLSGLPRVRVDPRVVRQVARALAQARLGAAGCGATGARRRRHVVDLVDRDYGDSLSLHGHRDRFIRLSKQPVHTQVASRSRTGNQAPSGDE